MKSHLNHLRGAGVRIYVLTGEHCLIVTSIILCTSCKYKRKGTWLWLINIGCLLPHEF